jgi:hypothetical protein
MRRTYILLSLFLLVVIFCGYVNFANKNFNLSESITANQIRATQIALTKPPTAEILIVPPVDMPKVLSSSYRLRPDKRFLISIQEAYKFFSKQKKARISVEFLEGKWVILCNEQEVGRLPEFPDFADFLAVISNWSKQLNKEIHQNLARRNSEEHFPGITNELNKFLAPQVAIALQNLNKLWEQGKRDPKLLQYATQGLISIALQSSQQLEISDLVYGKALAFLGITQSLTELPMKREEALLSGIMDYSAHAEKVAKNLQASDSIANFILKNDAVLEKQAQSEDSSTEAKFLWLIRLAQNKQMKQWYEWVMMAFGDDSLPLSVLKTGLEMKSFVGSRHFTKEMQKIAIQELSSEQDWQWDQYKPVKFVKAMVVNNKYYQVLNSIVDFGPTARSRIAQLESRLKTMDEKFSGPFLDTNTHRSYYRGHFYSSLFIEGRHYLITLSDINGARRFAGNMQGRFISIDKKVQSLKKDIDLLFPSSPVSNNPVSSPAKTPHGNYTDSSTASGEFVNWYDHLVSAREGEINTNELNSDMQEISVLGIPALFQTYQSLVVNYSTMDPSILKTIKDLAARMDSRNRHRRMLGNIAFDNLNDLKLTEKLYRSIEVSSPSNYVDILIANGNRSRNDKQLFKHLMLPNLSPDNKSDILFQLYFLSPDSHPRIEKEYQRLLKRNPEDWGLTNGYAGFLMKKNDFVKARILIRNWQKLELVTLGLERVNAQTKLARTYYEEGLYEEAWTEIAKVIEGQAGSSLQLAGKVLNKLGRLEDAESIFRFNAKRYSSHIKSLTPLIGFLWEHDRASEAAKLLKDFNRPISGKHWNSELAQPFSELFGSQPVEKGTQAFAHLIKAGMNPMELHGIPAAIFKEGNAELAFKTQSQLHYVGRGQLLINFNAYTYLKEWQGEAKALEWLKKVITAPAINQSSDIILSTKEYSLLWKFIQKPDEYAWLSRAAGYSSDKNLSEKNKTALFQYFKSPNKNPHYHIVGQYMLGMVTEQELLNAADSPKKRCEYAYFIAYKARVEGDYEKASDWYRIVLETGQAFDGEYYMALKQLMGWRSQYRYLSKLEPALS